MATDYNAIVPILEEANHPEVSGWRAFIPTQNGIYSGKTVQSEFMDILRFLHP